MVAHCSIRNSSHLASYASFASCAPFTTFTACFMLHLLERLPQEGIETMMESGCTTHHSLVSLTKRSRT